MTSIEDLIQIENRQKTKDYIKTLSFDINFLTEYDSIYELIIMLNITDVNENQISVNKSKIVISCQKQEEVFIKNFNVILNIIFNEKFESSIIKIQNMVNNYV